MAVKTTPYLALPYGEGGDAGFRTTYNESMDKIDLIAKDGESAKYPDSPRSIFDDSIFTPGSRFELRDGLARYLKMGNKFYFEVAVTNKAAISVPANGDLITNLLVGTLSPRFKLRRGSFISSINGIAACYYYGTGSGGDPVYISSFGGMSFGKSIPKGTYFGIAGHYYLSV